MIQGKSDKLLKITLELTLIEATSQLTAENPLHELKLKSSEQLITQAEELGIENASTLRKQEILFAILKKVAEKEEITGAGVLQLLQDGFGFLRAMESNYLPGPDDIYVSPSQIRKFGLRTGDTIEGPVRAPKELSLIHI